MQISSVPLGTFFCHCEDICYIWQGGRATGWIQMADRLLLANAAARIHATPRISLHESRAPK